MVEREQFDEWLRERARRAGADRIAGLFVELERDSDGVAVVRYRGRGEEGETRLRARAVIGADGARSRVAAAVAPGERTPCVFAYHEIVRLPAKHDARRCDVYYQGNLSPDFYGWVFPHGDTASVGVGSAQKGFSLRGAVKALREHAGLQNCELVRSEGAPIPLKPLKRWDNGRDVVLAGDAAGVVAPASGEGIYYAMIGGATAATVVDDFLRTGDARVLAGARKSFMREHGRVFWILGVMQHFWYRNDRRRERFVTMCRDPDVQRLTWQAYLNKKLSPPDPGAHMRIFLKDMGHLLGLSAP
jgi:geranylgeranyl reductase